MADLNADDSTKPCNQITQVHYFDGGPPDINEQNITRTAEYSQLFQGKNNDSNRLPEVMSQNPQKQSVQDLKRQRALQKVEELMREMMNSCENENEATQIKKHEQKEQELLKVINERQQEIDNLKGQLDTQKVENRLAVQELTKTIDSLNKQLKEKEQDYAQQKERLALEEINKLLELQENLQNQQRLKNKREDLANNNSSELELMKKGKKMIQDKLQEAIAETEAKSNNWPENQEQQQQAEKDSELVLREKESAYTLLENKHKQTLQVMASQEKQLNDFKATIVSYQQEAKKLQETNLSQKSELENKNDKISQLNQQMKDFYEQWGMNMNKIISQKDKESSDIKDKASQESQLEAPKAKDLLG